MNASRKTMEESSAEGSRATNPAEQLEEKCAKIRCVDMFTEWRLCISAYHQFHQYYIYGEFSQCKVEKARMYNCFKSKTARNEKAKRALVESLETEQQNMHTPNPPWEMRKTPPSDWNDDP